MRSPEPPVAAFDFDGTLIDTDALAMFFRGVVSRPRLAAKIAQNGVAATRAVVMGGHHRDRLKERLVLDLFGGRTDSDMRTSAHALANSLIAEHLRSDVTGRLSAHQAAGHRCVIVSASFAAYVEPVAKHLGVADVLATDWETNEHGVLTGRLAAPNVRGTRKVELLLNHLGGRPTELWAYGDSQGDAALLDAADHGVWVRDCTIEPEFSQATP